MKDQVFGILQRVGRSFMLPIAILPVAGLLLGIGGSFSNTTMLEAYRLMGIMGPGTIPNRIFQVMNASGNIVFENLPLLFAMGVAIGMAKKEKEVAALSAAISFFIMHAALSAMITINGGTETLPEGAGALVVGIPSLQMGVFGGILVGLGVSWLHNRFYRIELPQVLSFFGGTRFVPIISALAYVAVGILMYFIWPPIQGIISRVGDFVLNSGYVGTWFYGFMERALIPFGLHHVFYIPFWQTAVGGTMEIGGRLVEGAQNIFFAQLADPSVTRFASSATRFMSGKFPLMIFGLPGAALAMYRAALPERKKEVFGLLASAALTSMLTGITEPLEFTFLFVAPVLYVIHCIFAGLAYMLMHLFHVGVGMTFSGGLIDLLLFGVLQGNAKTGWLWIPVVGIGYFLAYYVIFSSLIRWRNLKTPGREETGEARLYTRKDLETRKQDGQSARIVAGLGGHANISDVDCCATRLRCTVYDAVLVDDAVLKETGASGIIRNGQGIQIIYGPRVTAIKSALDDYMESGKEENAEPASRENTAKKSVMLGSPMTGTAGSLSQVPDEGFLAGMMGEGAFILPTTGEVLAPCDGTVTFVFPTGHALGFETADGMNLLIHVGIDTVKLEGKGFTPLVGEGALVKKGDKLLSFDLEYIRDHAPSLASPVVFPELKDGWQVQLKKEGAIRAGEDFLLVSQDGHSEISHPKIS